VPHLRERLAREPLAERVSGLPGLVLLCGIARFRVRLFGLVLLLGLVLGGLLFVELLFVELAAVLLVLGLPCAIAVVHREQLLA
jgi:hypothetical protein